MSPIPLFTSGEKPSSPPSDVTDGNLPDRTRSAPLQQTNTDASKLPTAVDERRRSDAHKTEKLSKEEADRLYEERIEDEYAKREGGA